MNYIGISAGFHDAAISVVDDHGNILFAGHSERYSKNKHDKDVCEELLIDALKHTNSSYLEYHYYERPWIKALRQLRTGEGFTWPSWEKILGSIYHQMGAPKIHTHGHHLCHAAAGFQTSPFEDATVVVIDAIVKTVVHVCKLGKNMWRRRTLAYNIKIYTTPKKYRG